MYHYFIPDRAIAIEFLAQIDWDIVDIIYRVDPPLANGLPSATFIYQATKILVRFDEDGHVTHLIALHLKPATYMILDALSNEFHTTFSYQTQRELAEGV